jgi:3',5'-cyclic AMP phosphodiesterase CpdA
VADLRIAHISDLHVPSRWRRAPWLYLGKRLIGTLNYKLRRAREHPLETITALVRGLAADASIDHVVVTGDLTNVSLVEEFQAARELLEPLIARGPGFLSVIPGNHDRYTYTSHWRGDFERFFADCMTSEVETGGPFPFVRFRGEVAILGLDSGIATPPFRATGALGAAQRARLVRALAEPRVAQAGFRLALVHHPPMIEGGGRDHRTHRLTDDRELLEIAATSGIDLLLHGHIHEPFTAEKTIGGRVVRGIGVGSSTRLHRSPELVGGVNVYTFRDGKLLSVETRTYDPATGSYSGRRATG